MQTVNIFLTPTKLVTSDDRPRRKATIQRSHPGQEHLSSQLQLTNITTMFTDLWPRTVTPPSSSTSSLSSKKSSLYSESLFNPHSWNPLVSPTIPTLTRERPQPSALANFVQTKSYLTRYTQHHRPSRNKASLSVRLQDKSTKNVLSIHSHHLGLFTPSKNEKEKAEAREESSPLLPPINRTDPSSAIRRRQLNFFLPSMEEQCD